MTLGKNAIRTIDSKSTCKVAKNQRNLAMGDKKISVHFARELDK